MTTERFRWWHIPEVLLIEDDLFGAEQWSAAMFWNELAQRHHYRVVLDGDRVLGYAGLAISDSYESWVQNIAVRRDAQKRGIGRALLEDLLAKASAERVEKVLLEVAVDNVAAQRLYARYDFEAIGIRKGYYQPSNTDAVVMMRNA